MWLNNANGVILTDAATDMFLAALSITLFLDTQKNCVCRKSSIMEATCLLHGDPIPPVPGATSIFVTTMHPPPPPDTPICACYSLAGVTQNSVTGSNIVELLRATAKQIGF